MKFKGQEVNFEMIIWFALNILIIIDILLITIAMLFTLPEGTEMGIQMFDFCVCILLMAEWLINLYLSASKTEYLKEKYNILALIASIPFDVIIPIVIPGINLLRYFRLLKLLRIIALFNMFIDGINRFIKKTNLDKILTGVFLTILIFTGALYIWGTSYSLFDDFYFVIVTLTTVGYGDITPQTYNEKVISIVLIFVGVFIFSTITAAISSFLTDRLLKDDDEELENLIEEKYESLSDELKTVKEENKKLHEDIKELKELVKNK